ncbi:MAG TPA: hypothetical protein VL944_02080 [Candidatus Acidoferrum sp.]|nr:hypothetical protein [Candidatus Acidoferrum sp.]
MKTGMTIGLAIVIGIVITLLTYFVNITPGGLVGATWYGYPLNWINKLITYPTAWAIQWLGLVVDIVFWAIIALIVLLVVKLAMKK